MKKAIILIMVICVLALAGCNKSQSSGVSDEAKDNSEAGENIENKDKTEEEAKHVESSGKKSIKLTLSNMADESSLEEVKSALLTKIKPENVEAFLNLVKDYNSAVETKGLIGAFTETIEPEYDVLTLSELWTAKKGEFIGTNCRLNAFTLLKDDIEIGETKTDANFLFMDNDAIEVGKLFSKDDEILFQRLFSRVKTEASKDIGIHAAKMKEHLSAVKFSEEARMISLVIHDTIDGDYLFIGHTGVMTDNGGYYLFVEKLAFDQPYQALKFKNKEDCYIYLYSKYKHYQDETSSKPFIMDNADLVELEQYNID